MIRRRSLGVIKEFTKGIYKENPVFRLVLGLCPTLAVSSSVKNGIGMGMAVLAVLVSSNFIISIIRSFVPKKIRIPIYITVIATFVTIVELVMHAYFPALYEALGIFVPLIVVNCIILGRAEAFASKNNPFYSIVDGLGMGLGFSLSLVVISSIREIIGNGSWYGIRLAPQAYQPVMIMIMAPGAFLTLGYILAFFNWLDLKKTSR